MKRITDSVNWIAIPMLLIVLSSVAFSGTIHGGFPPSNGTLANRDPNQYTTVLSGDLLGHRGLDLDFIFENK